uniref:Uncharacterized protein n=1 Tax=Odontella aurita TaxID=265563 RepID=A0A7S4JF58_9STRA|mmetsp:Transcript_45423/g.138192  ORF Transcript_45423/g.138192 Transcript_45423/m.138192 type:complete len:272 (+) Transcript_45423:149-964(+)|eukprot:CAMPEP_0113550944 /NCGR_PEP_ID=MMETSP0015_2-20120614/14255_1 /TAXON_ID=2838 /ORGANISM="Odontella" /LENGTH=271 /DNA_ID=CAMNT_0000451791 /DNA_START=80 /DNA_END=895 /DNA_ORIENTATION=- /assembly_acc=CAM_ASM_000160
MPIRALLPPPPLLALVLLLSVLAAVVPEANAWTGPPKTRRRTSSLYAAASPSQSPPTECRSSPSIDGLLTTNRRDAVLSTMGAVSSAAALALVGNPSPSFAYAPDPDPQRESLYFVSRVQEATVQQERFVDRASRQEDLKSKMKLTLRLVEKNYRLLDQINYMSAYVTPSQKVVEATSAGVEAVEALQNAIDYVRDELKSGPLEEEQREYLVENLRTCREQLFVFLKYVPQDKLEGARKRVEDENVSNREEYDGDGTEGVYNPVVLPWKNQ